MNVPSQPNRYDLNSSFCSHLSERHVSQRHISESHRSKKQGFTLVELLIVVAIVAIIAAVAIPTFSSQSKKAYRADAQACLMQLSSAMERFRTVNNTYQNTHAGGTPVSTFFPTTCPLESANALYTLTIDTTITGYDNHAAYELRAVPISTQRMNGDYTFILHFTGQKQKILGATTTSGWEI